MEKEAAIPCKADVWEDTEKGQDFQEANFANRLKIKISSINKENH